MGSLSYSTFFAGMKTAVFVFFILITQSACPDNPTETECGENQIDVNGTCECAEGYHWNEDQTQCNMDTTSHNFVWEIDTLGNYGSYLKDVAIIDENNVWVVGKIETDSGYFGAAIWNGDKWALKKLNGPGINTQSISPRGIWAFSENDIWFASGSIFHWDGVETSLMWERNIGTNETVEQIWGSSNSDIYFVGNEGTIVHYDGADFVKMESGTEVDLTDIWGVSNSEIWVAGRDNYGSVILNYDENEWTIYYKKDLSLDSYTLPQNSILLSISSIWTNVNMDSIIAVGAWGGFSVNKLNGKANWSYKRRWDNLFDNTGYPLKTRGRSKNDIFICGDMGHIMHFNGNSWKRFDNFYEHEGLWLNGIAFSENYTYFIGSNLFIKSFSTNGNERQVQKIVLMK